MQSQVCLGRAGSAGPPVCALSPPLPGCGSGLHWQTGRRRQRLFRIRCSNGESGSNTRRELGTGSVEAQAPPSRGESLPEGLRSLPCPELAEAAGPLG